jgi:putative ABC transport system permease protein
METLLQDFRYALRQLRKNPGFTAIAVLTLALGIAVNATMFSMVSAFLLRKPPGRDPEHVAVVTGVDPAQGFQADAKPVSVPNYLAWRNSNHVFTEMAAANEYHTASFSAQQHSPESLNTAAVSANYFSVLGVTPQLGRTFMTGEDQPGRDHVVILSHGLWERDLGSDPAVIGSTVRLNRETYTVVGVMPASFSLMGFIPQMWTPLVLSPSDQTAAAHRDRYLFLFARMKPGVSMEQASAEFSTLGRQAEQSFPDTEKGWGVMVRTLPDFLIYSFSIRSALAVLMTTVGFVLLIACANVAGLLLARATGRRKEVAIRASLGAGRLRIIRQLLTEGLAIAGLGGGTGLLFTFWGVKLVRANMTFNDQVSSIPFTIDRNVLMFSAGVSLVCAVLCGLAPALNASRTDITTNLKDESRAASVGRSRSRLRTVMVGGEVALALFLLVGTGLLVHALFEIEHQNLGFRADHLLTAGLTLDQGRYEDSGKQSLFVRDLLSRLQNLPGAESVAAVSDLPSTGPGSVTLRIKGQQDAPSSQGLSALDFVVTPDYLRTAGVALLHGRTFADADDAKAPRVLLVNQKFVERYLAGQEALGQQVRLEVNGAPSGWSQIIGVVSNVKTYSESTRDDPEVYEAYLQRPVASFSVMVRTSSDPSVLITGVRSTVAQLDAELPLARVMSMPAVLEAQREGNPFFVYVLESFAIMALLLAAIGIYGLIAYSVGQRAHEIGIRMALGAKRQDVQRMVLAEGLKMAAVGGAIGLALALPLPKLFGAIFFDLHVNEPWVYFVVAVAILLVAMFATYFPARRAARVEPMNALRQE